MSKNNFMFIVLIIKNWKCEYKLTYYLADK